MERGDSAAVVQVIEQVLGCAVQCERKSEFITAIATSMPETAKHHLMASIQRIMAALKPSQQG